MLIMSLCPIIDISKLQDSSESDTITVDILIDELLRED